MSFFKYTPMTALGTVRALIHSRCQLRQAELTPPTGMKVGQVGPKPGGSERLSCKDFLSQIVFFFVTTGLFKRVKNWTAEVNPAGPENKPWLNRRHRGLWSPAVPVYRSLVSGGKWGSKKPYTVRGVRGPPTDSGQEVLTSLRDQWMANSQDLTVYMPERFFLY